MWAAFMEWQATGDLSKDAVYSAHNIFQDYDPTFPKPTNTPIYEQWRIMKRYATAKNYTKEDRAALTLGDEALCAHRKEWLIWNLIQIKGRRKYPRP